jgi:hypothetical protein
MHFHGAIALLASLRLTLASCLFEAAPCKSPAQRLEARVKGRDAHRSGFEMPPGVRYCRRAMNELCLPLERSVILMRDLSEKHGF